MNIIEQLEKEEMERLAKPVPEFAPGDTVKVGVKLKEGERERIQAYEGVVIGRAGSGLNENFTVRKISFGEGVERVFPIYSPSVASIISHRVKRSATPRAASRSRFPVVRRRRNPCIRCRSRSRIARTK